MNSPLTAFAASTDPVPPHTVRVKFHDLNTALCLAFELARRNYAVDVVSAAADQATKMEISVGTTDESP